MKKLLISGTILAASVLGGGASPASSTLEEQFLSPAPEQRPIIIWQWMDGLVTREGITKDLEAFKEAGLAGVQNFQIGGPRQIRIGNPDNAIGSDSWKDLLRWTLDECERLSLTFGTHNCPGWSSSAFPTVEPRHSMLRLVYSEIPLPDIPAAITLPTPSVDPQWDYYEDVTVVAIPRDSSASLSQIIPLDSYFDPSTATLSLPSSLCLPANTSILRIGQTTIGKTNEAQAPESGRGLECDKLSREAVKSFWDTYPAMVIETAGRHAGKTFTHFEIDSYEAGGQTWSPVLPDEFLSCRGYSLRPFLPYMVGRLKTIENDSVTRRFQADWQETVKDCVAENYYGYLTQLAARHGVRMLVEPYGTGGQKPFGIIDFEKIVNACGENADIATEFWQDPPRWGWKDMTRHEASMRRMSRPIMWAEAFTCWPLRAWSDSPATLKPMCDRAFCKGVNRMMLHAAGANPWPSVEPGMSFGIWGTHFVPGQTWWKAGGAKALFDYMARCQALLQQGIPAPEQLPEIPGLLSYRRALADDDTDIIFLCNPTDTAVTSAVPVELRGRCVEVWDPYTLSRFAARRERGGAPLVTIEPSGSRFLIVTPGESMLSVEPATSLLATSPVTAEWTLTAPGIEPVRVDSLFSWADSEHDDLRYFSGTATYTADILIVDSLLPSSSAQGLILSLGEVREMAKVTINGQQLPLAWKAPYDADITEYAVAGHNEVTIEVTNLWPNRMIGDERYPDDLEWSEPLVYTYAPGSPTAGRYLASEPEWLKKGLPRPSEGRKTVGCFKFFTADSPLLPSGLQGPVSLSLIEKGGKKEQTLIFGR